MNLMQTPTSLGNATMRMPRRISPPSTIERTRPAPTEQWCRKRERETREVAVREERIRLAREIHDTVAQTLTGVILHLVSADDVLSRGLTGVTRECLQQAIELAREGLAETRRTVHGLRAQAAETDDLCSTAEKLVRRMTAPTQLRAKLIVRGKPQPLRPDCNEHILRIIQESLTNVLRHARANVFVAELRFSRESFTLHVRDNGRGFDMSRYPAGYGLLGMRERVAVLSGQLTINSAPGQGTDVKIVVPVDGRTGRGTSL
jgi:signal transduction histidine kinase